VLLVVFRTG